MFKKRASKPLYTQQVYNENLTPVIQFGLARSFNVVSEQPVLGTYSSFYGQVNSPMTRIKPRANQIKTQPNAFSLKDG